MSRRIAKVVFMGSPEFAVPTLEALVDAPQFEVVRLVTQPARPKGRGKKVTPTAVRVHGDRRGIPALEMSKQNYREAAGALCRLRPDFIVVAAFGIILRDDLLALPPRGCVNLHASLLPRYRGVSPIQAAILAGDRETGCTTMLMDAGVDTGDILLTRSIEIADDDTAGTLEAKLARIGAALVIETLEGIIDGTVHPRKQNDEAATYTKKIRKEHGRIDWTENAAGIWRQVRAMNPWPAAHTSCRGRRLIVLEARLSDQPAGGVGPGGIVALDPLVVETGDGAIELVRVQVEGKRATAGAAFCQGARLRVGDRLG